MGVWAPSYNSIFSHDTPKFGCGDGKIVKSGKKCIKREESKASICWGVQRHFFPITPIFGFGDGKNGEKEYEK